MDLKPTWAVMDLVRNYLRQTGAGLLLITHQPTLASTLDRIMILEQGKITASGSPKQLLETDNSFSAAYQHILHPKQNASWQA